MNWFNVYGLIFMVIIMIPNIVFAVKCKDGFGNSWKNKTVEVLEQIGRFSSFAFMVINVPKLFIGFSSNEMFALYLIIDSVLILAYCIIWIVCFKNNSIFRALSLSIIPSVIFLFSGIMSNYILLIISSVIFAPNHILLSYKNAKS